MIAAHQAHHLTATLGPRSSTGQMPAPCSALSSVTLESCCFQNTLSVITFDPEDGLGVLTVEVGDGARDVVLSPDGTKAYVVNREGDSVWAIDTATYQRIGEPITVAHPEALAVSPDASLLYVTSFDGDITADNVVVIDADTGEVIGQPIRVGPASTDIAVSPDGTRIYVTNTNDGRLSVISLVPAEQSATAVGDRI